MPYESCGSVVQSPTGLRRRRSLESRTSESGSCHSSPDFHGQHQNFGAHHQYHSQHHSQDLLEEQRDAAQVSESGSVERTSSGTALGAAAASLFKPGAVLRRLNSLSNAWAHINVPLADMKWNSLASAAPDAAAAIAADSPGAAGPALTSDTTRQRTCSTAAAAAGHAAGAHTPADQHAAGDSLSLGADSDSSSCMPALQGDDNETCSSDVVGDSAGAGGSGSGSSSGGAYMSGPVPSAGYVGVPGKMQLLAAAAGKGSRGYRIQPARDPKKCE